MVRSRSSINSIFSKHHWLTPVLKKRTHMSHNAHPGAHTAKSLSGIRMGYITLAVGLGISGSLEHRSMEQYAPKKGYNWGDLDLQTFQCERKVSLRPIHRYIISSYDPAFNVNTNCIYWSHRDSPISYSCQWRICWMCSLIMKTTGTENHWCPKCTAFIGNQAMWLLEPRTILPSEECENSQKLRS